MRSFYFGLLGIFFLCGFTSTLPTTKFQDTRDEIDYAAISIGDLQVMTNNLQFQNEFSYCYDNLERYCNHFGQLYNYHSLVDNEGNLKNNICPKAWKVPTLEDWEYMILGMKPKVTRSKEGQLVYHVSENYARLQFGGFRSHEGQFYFNMGKEGHYMTSTETYKGWATIKIKRQGEGYDLTISTDTDKNRAVSCRCIQNKENLVQQN